MVWKRCANGVCRKEGTLNCGKCKFTPYCSKSCQRDHWKKHKVNCVAYKPMSPGKFDFLKLPREVRDKIYKELLLARLTPEFQKQHDEIDRVCGESEHRYRYRCRNIRDGLEERACISPGATLWDKKGFQPLNLARGLLFANKQIADEVTDALYSMNTFFVPVAEDWRYQVPGQIFLHKIKASSIARIQKLVIFVCSDLDVESPNYRKAVARVKHNMGMVVRSLNAAGNNLKYLKVRYISCYAGEVEKNRRDIDALLDNPKARPVHLVLANGRNDFIDRNNVKRFHAHGFSIGDALAKLNVPVEKFQIYGDLPGSVIERLNTKFGVTDQPAWMPPPPARVDEETGQSRDDFADLMRELSLKEPDNEYYAKMARDTANRPIKSDALMAMFFGPPTPEELERIRCRG